MISTRPRTSPRTRIRIKTEDQVEDEDQSEVRPRRPLTADNTGSITVYEWDCPAGFDVAVQDANPWIECAVATDDVAFTISGARRRDRQRASRRHRRHGLAAGDYQIDDTQANDAASGLVLACHGLTTSTAYPLYITESGAPLEIALRAGQQVASSGSPFRPRRSPCPHDGTSLNGAGRPPGDRPRLRSMRSMKPNLALVPGCTSHRHHLGQVHHTQNNSTHHGPQIFDHPS